MNATELVTLSMSELKAICSSHAIEVTGDRRYRISYINAIEMWNQRSVATIETPDPFDDSYEFVMSSETAFQSGVPDVLSVIDKSDNTATLQQLTNDPLIPQPAPQPMPQPTPQPTPQPIPQPPTTQQQPKTQYRGASIVMIIPLILVTVAVMTIKIGISTLIPLIGSLMRFTGSIWQSFTGVDRRTSSIDYFPPVPA